MPQVNHLDVVQRLHAEKPPDHTVEDAFRFTLRVIQALPPAERAGVLRKDAGENVVNYTGVMVSAARICYPDGQVYKALGDVPTTNFPEWLDDGTVDSSRYVAVANVLAPSPEPSPSPSPSPSPLPTPPPPSFDLEQAFEQLFTAADRIIGAMEQIVVALHALSTRFYDLQAHGLRVHL